jgi:lysophospholipase L1-like esterase
MVFMDKPVSKMDKPVSKKILLFGLLALMSFAWPAENKVAVWMIGDSTMCRYDSSRFPLTGWGMPFADYFSSAVTIKNKARGGRSTRTFLSEGLWQPIKDSLREGDYVFIQFGHNDEAENYPDRYTPPAAYRKNLIRFVNDARAKKAIPVLITPVSRRKFDAAGHALETHAVYSGVVREVAHRHHVPLIDLDRMSIDLYQRYGPENAKLLFNLLAPGENPAYPKGIAHNKTHFNAYGARHIAELVLRGIEQLHLKLADYIVRN